MFLVPTLLFTSLSLVASVNNSAYSSSYCDTSNHAVTQTNAYFILDYVIDDSADVETFDVGSVRIKSDFTFENGKYTDVPNSVAVNYTGYFWGEFTRVYDNVNEEYKSHISFGHSSTPINMIVSFSYADIYYLDVQNDLVHTYRVDSTDFQLNENDPSVTNLGDMYLISRDDDDFYIYFDEPTGFASLNDAVYFMGMSFSFRYIVLPYFDSALTGDEYQLGYNDGYSVGIEEGQGVGYDTGYQSGYETGYNSGYGTGYNYGYDLGQNSDTNLRDIFFNIADVPIITMRGLFDFELFGMSMYAFVGSLIALFVMLLIVRKVF